VIHGGLTLPRVSETKRWLSRLRIKGFRSFADVTFEPGRADVLIGPNGAGKSNLLQFLRMIAMVRTQSLGLFVARDCGGASGLFHSDGTRRTQTIECELEFSASHQGTSRYRAAWQLAAGDRLVFVSEEIGIQERGRSEWDTEKFGAGHFESATKFESEVKPRAKARTSKLAAHLNLRLKGLSFFHFHDTSVSSLLRGNARIADGAYLRSDGSNLAAYLYALRESDDEADQAAWRHIGSLVRQVAPFVKELQPTAVSASGTPQVREASEGGSVRLQLRRRDPATLKEWGDAYSMGRLFEKGVLGGQP
jgi:predicted ATPase